MNEEILKFLAAGFGIKVEELKENKFEASKLTGFKLVKSEEFAKMKPEADFVALTAEKNTAVASLATATTDLTKAQADVVTLTAEKTNLTAMATIGTSIVNAARTEAKRVYGLFSKNKPDETITKRIEAEADLVKLEADIKMWGGQAVTEFSPVCNGCGSKDINFRQSKDKNQGGDEHQGHNDTKSALNSAASRM